MAAYVEPDYVESDYVEGDEEIPILIPYVSISLGRMGATIYGAAGAFDIPHLAMAALTGLWVEWQAAISAARAVSVWVHGVWEKRMGTGMMPQGGVGAG